MASLIRAITPSHWLFSAISSITVPPHCHHMWRQAGGECDAERRGWRLSATSACLQPGGVWNRMTDAVVPMPRVHDGSCRALFTNSSRSAAKGDGSEVEQIANLDGKVNRDFARGFG